MRKLLLIIWILGVIGLTGCSDFLEPKSSDEYVPENATSLDELLVETAYVSWERPLSLFLYHNFFSDDITITDAPVGFHEYEQLNKDAWFSLYTMQPDMFVGMDVTGVGDVCWDEYYKAILGCNAALDYLDDVRDSEEMKRYVAAQALALRAYYYFQLVNLYGAPYNVNPDAPGVPLKLISNLNVEHMTRNSVGEVYAQVCKDLALSDSLFCLLPVEKQFQKNYRISLPGVRFLRSRVNLYMENWDETIRWADSVMLWAEFSLYDLMSFVPGDPYDGKPAKPNYSDYSSGEVIWCNGSVRDLRLLVSQECSDNTVDPTWRKVYPLFIASPELLATYTIEDSIRKDLYIFDEYINNAKTGRKRAVGKMPLDTKSVNLSIDDNGGLALSFRLSEIYLNLAEAHAMLGNDSEALRYLNDLRRKRIKDYKDIVGLSGEQLIQFVKDERRRELCFEGHRWFDQRRWGMESFTRRWKQFDGEYENYVIEKNDPAFTLPIPEEVIERNPEIEQNPLAQERHVSL